MVEIEDKLISLDLFDKKFVCDLSACKGACCVKGDSGAPLEEDEILKLEKELPIIKSNMREEGVREVEENGVYYFDEENEPVTSLVNGEECAFVYFDSSNIAKCAIEKTFNENKTSFMKPISCHLYPIRVSNLNAGQAINYNKWDICKPACDCGEKLKVPVFRFLKNAIIRKWGELFFNELENVDKHLKGK